MGASLGDVHVEIGEGEVVVSVKDVLEKQQKALWGLFRSLVQNLVLGVSSG
jgi:ribosomal protein L6P/L9E